MTVLSGHMSPETAYVVADYPVRLPAAVPDSVLDRNHQARPAGREPDHEPQASGHRLEQAQGVHLLAPARALHCRRVHGLRRERRALHLRG